MQPPARIGGQLHRLRTGQQHAKAQRIQELLLGEPATVFDDLLMHQCDLGGGAAKAQQADTKENAEQIAKIRAVGRETGRQVDLRG